MEWITHNPHSDTCPDYGSVAFTVVQAALIAQNNIDKARATQLLADAWKQDNNSQKEAWDQQVHDDLHLQEETECLAHEEEDYQWVQKEQEEKAEKCDLEKKKPKMKEFDHSTMVNNFITPRPSTYALNKLKAFEYVELWYFTPGGHLDAMESQQSQVDDTFSIAKIGNSFALRQLSAVKASYNAIKDADVTWE
jgi:hypothetical protein